MSGWDTDDYPVDEMELNLAIAYLEDKPSLITKHRKELEDVMIGSSDDTLVAIYEDYSDYEENTNCLESRKIRFLLEILDEQ